MMMDMNVFVRVTYALLNGERPFQPGGHKKYNKKRASAALAEKAVAYSYCLDSDDDDEPAVPRNVLKDRSNVVVAPAAATAAPVTKKPRHVGPSSSKKEKKTFPSSGSIRGIVETCPTDRIWNEMFARLLHYKSIYGNCVVPGKYDPDQKLANWVRHQREQYKASVLNLPKRQLSKDRIEKLNLVEFAWSSPGNKNPL
jgi:hypothetical protein